MTPNSSKRLWARFAPLMSLSYEKRPGLEGFRLSTLSFSFLSNFNFLYTLFCFAFSITAWIKSLPEKDTFLLFFQKSIPSLALSLSLVLTESSFQPWAAIMNTKSKVSLKLFFLVLLYCLLLYSFGWPFVHHEFLLSFS